MDRAADKFNYKFLISVISIFACMNNTRVYQMLICFNLRGKNFVYIFLSYFSLKNIRGFKEIT